MRRAMLTDLQLRCETMEACYEFTLSYAAQGLPTDEGSASGKQLRDHLSRAIEALRGIEKSCADAVTREQLEPRDKYQAFLPVLARDAQSSLAVLELVQAQPAISSQLIDNLNASIHLRALLADLFLITEILQLHQSQSNAIAAN
jgi:hypothetical protein